MKNLTIALVVCLNLSCAEDTSNSSPSPLETPVQAAVEPSPAEDEPKADTTTENIDVNGLKASSSLIRTALDLKPCTEAEEGFLVYILDIQELQTCSSEGGWTVIDLKGVDGQDGEEGQDGINGRDGLNGVNGINGVSGANGTNGGDGTDGEDGRDGVAIDNTWRDAATNRLWLIGSLVQYSQVVNVGLGCPTGWTYPNGTDLQLAIIHGLGLASTALGGNAYFWGENIYGGYLVYPGQAMPEGSKTNLACFKD